MLKFIAYIFIVFISCFSKSIAIDETRTVFQNEKLDSKIIEEENIYIDDIKVDYLFVKGMLDLRRKSTFNALNINSENVYKLLTPTNWCAVFCETVMAAAATGVKREWKIDVPNNVNVNIFIPDSVVGGNIHYLHILLHRIIPLAVYRVIEKETKSANVVVKIKWPNDVIVDNKKIYGGMPDWFGSTDEVVSFQFGININMPQNKLNEIDQPATSLSVILGKPVDHKRIFKEVITEIVRLFNKYKGNLPELDKELCSKIAFIGEEVVIYDYVPGKNIEGVLEKVSKGMIYIRNNQNKKIYCISPGNGLLRLKKQQKK